MSFAGSNLDDAIVQVLEGIATDTIHPLAIDRAVGINELRRVDVKPPRLVWVPTHDDGYRDPHEQPEDGHAIYETTTYCDVYAWGLDLLEATKLRDVTLRQGWTIFSPNAFKVPTSGRQAYTDGAKHNSLGLRIKFQVGFLIPIYDEIWLQGHVATATPALVLLNPPGPSEPLQ